MASIPPMTLSNVRGHRRRSISLSGADAAALSRVAEKHRLETKAKEAFKMENKIHIEHKAGFYPGFGKEPPKMVKPLMMIDPKNYHHMRKWAVRLAP